MGFKKVAKTSRNTSNTAVSYPAIILKSGRANSTLNSAFVRKIEDIIITKEIEGKSERFVNIDVLIDEDTNRVAFAFCENDKGEDGMCTYVDKKITKSNQISLWLGSLLASNGLRLKGHKSKSKDDVITEVCELVYDKKLDMWIFEVPQYAIDAGESEESTEKIKTKKKKNKDKNKKKKKILSK